MLHTILLKLKSKMSGSVSNDASCTARLWASGRECRGGCAAETSVYSRCDSDWKLAARSAADRCRGRGLWVTGDLKGSAVKRDHKAKWLCVHWALNMPIFDSFMQSYQCKRQLVPVSAYWNSKPETVVKEWLSDLWFQVFLVLFNNIQWLKQRTVANSDAHCCYM